MNKCLKIRIWNLCEQKKGFAKKFNHYNYNYTEEDFQKEKKPGENFCNKKKWKVLPLSKHMYMDLLKNFKIKFFRVKREFPENESSHIK